jgi:hypothetical protein
MKKFLLIIFLFFSPIVLAIELKPLKDIWTELDPNDQVTKIYFYSRCGGLYGALWDAMLNQNKEVAEMMLKHQQKLLAYASVIDNQLNETEITESFEKQKNNMQELKDIYVELFNKNWFEQGAYFQGTWIEGDVQLCGPIVESLPNIE